MDNNNNINNRGKPSFPKNPWTYILIAFAVIMGMNLFSISTALRNHTEFVDYSEFLDLVERGKVEKVEIDSDSISFTRKDNKGGNLLPTTSYYTYTVDDPELVDRLHAAGVVFAGVKANKMSFLEVLISFVVPLLLYGTIAFMIVRMLRGSKNGGGGGLFGFNKSSAKLYDVSESSNKFADVAGQDEAKSALTELVDFLHEPKKYAEVGAKLPKGALLVGPPGTGKTLLARAVAGEAGVPFFFVSGSAFVEMFVGAGAARVRDLFKQANEKAPCIIFIDEIDAIGKKRDASGIGGNDEREQTLNQLLAEMDGFDPGKGIIVLGATNRPEILDKALLRPGRFDRRIPVELPDMRGREAVLRVHAKNIVLDKNVDLLKIAKATVGASGADLANIINEAALRAVRVGRKEVTQADLDEAVEQVIAGSERKSLVVPEKEKRAIAYHEIGHALVAARQKDSAPVQKITIVPRTNGALGYTMQVEEEERVLMSREDIVNRLQVLTAGRAAEEFIFGNCTTGAANDIEQATKLARAMVTRFGMSEKFGMMALETVTGQYLGGDSQLICSQETAAQVDEEVRSLIHAAHAEASRILRENARQLNELATTLLERESITGDEFMEILERCDEQALLAAAMPGEEA